MALALSTSPAYPTAGQRVRVSWTGASGNYVRVWLTAAPLASKYRAQLDESDSNRVQLHEGDVAASWTFEPDVGGGYVLTVQEYDKGASSYGGGHALSTDAYQTETKNGSESSLTLYCAQWVEVPVGTGGLRARLRMLVHGDQVRATTVQSHGEKTPRLIPVDDVPAVEAAIADSTVLTKLAALDAEDLTADLDSLVTVFEDIRTNFTAHLSQSGVHNSDDIDNACGTAFRLTAGASISAINSSVQALARRMEHHMLNRKDGGSIGDEEYHYAAGAALPDDVNLPQVQGVSNVATAWNALLAMHRAYEGHRVSGIHDASDSTNTLAALNPAGQLFSAYYDAVGTTTPTAAATQNAGVLALVAGTGATVVG